MTPTTRVLLGACALLALIGSACGVDPQSDDRPFGVDAAGIASPTPATERA